LLIQKGARVDAVDNNGETATAIAERLKWKKVAVMLSDPSVLFWNFANRANKLYKATEFELAIGVYEKAFEMLENVKPMPSNQNRATLHYNCARAASNLGQHVKALEQSNCALKLIPTYNSALEQRAKCNLAIYNFKLCIDDLDTLISGAGGTDVSTGNLDLWVRLKRDAKAKLDETHFDTLGLSEKGKASTQAEVKKGYRNQCINWHPDKHVNSEEAKHRAHIMFQRVNEAHEVLSDPVKRRSYEYTMKFSPSSSASTPSYRGYSSKWSYEDDSEDDEDGHF
jgi:tetratricopeptide (TPR) repeat protein